jgi:transient receptor potential cation channel subfamily M protein 2
VADTTPIDKVIEIMNKAWRIDKPTKPSLVISVIGGAKNFALDGKKKEIFNDGLVKAALSTNAWIITSGSYIGVMRAVGEAVRDGQAMHMTVNDTHQLRCIGIAPWGYVLNRHCLVANDTKVGTHCHAHLTIV